MTVLRLFAAIVALLCLGGTGAAADGETMVKVALLDMSSVMGSGMAGYGMIGPGTTGQGMMGPGQMGPGMMGGGMMGPGMMGMGMMSIRTDQPSVKAGEVHFDVANWSRSFVHEMLVVAVDNPSAAIPYNYAEPRIAEDQVKVLGEIADLRPNASSTMDLNLMPGWYLLICNVAGHYAAGMVTQFHVAP
jgi:uncharacterized cupredoxin-like copper-binding protein